MPITSSDVVAGADALATDYNKLRADLLAAHHGMAGATKIVNADIDDAAAITATKIAGITVACEDTANKDTTTTLGTSDTKYPSQKAVKAYVDNATLVFKNGTTTYDISTADGTQNIAHGLGKTPKNIRLTFRGLYSGAGTQNTCDLVSNGTTVSSVCYNYNNATHLPSNGSTIILYSNTNNGTYVTGTVTFDGTNISIAWVKSGTPGGTTYILWEVEG
jgi:hypothetical protein